MEGNYATYRPWFDQCGACRPSTEAPTAPAAPPRTAANGGGTFLRPSASADVTTARHQPAAAILTKTAALPLRNLRQMHRRRPLGAHLPRKIRRPQLLPPRCVGGEPLDPAWVVTAGPPHTVPIPTPQLYATLARQPGLAEGLIGFLRGRCVAKVRIALTPHAVGVRLLAGRGRGIGFEMPLDVALDSDRNKGHRRADVG